MASRLTLEKGDHFAYLSAHTNLLTWGEVLEEQTEPKFLTCRTFSTVCAEGTEGLVLADAIMFRVDPFVFEFAREKGWPSTVVEFYSLSRQCKEQARAVS